MRPSGAARRGGRGTFILGPALSAAVLAVVLAAAPDASAHPHVFVDHTIAIPSVPTAWTASSSRGPSTRCSAA